ncbi:MAG TPA: hypothetical protein VE991_12425, partial [Acidimicrobiales bacterium]|nr:hypothetical protein [Acidimicrobiales bacterium]
VSPTVDSVAAPVYPGDIIANLGGLESEFFPPQLPNTPYPFDAHAQYPPSTGAPATSTFGGNAPSGLPVVPTVMSGVANATSTGGDATGTVADLTIGPGLAPGGAALVKIGSMVSSDKVGLGGSAITATAGSILRAIDIAGVIDITALDSEATSSSDGTTGNPAASLKLGSVTVAGNPAYIDANGVHIAGNGTQSVPAPTVAQLQKSLDATLAQDGIVIRLLDPVQTVTGAEGLANSGGLVISLAHSFNVPFINTGALTGGALQPCIPIPQLGSSCLPAGNYTATTSVTLGLATVDVNATGLAAQLNTNDTTTTLGAGGLGGSDLGLGNLGGGSFTSVGSLSGPGVSTSSNGGSNQAIGLTHFPIRGVPAPLGWVVVGIILCVVFAYPMLIAARWQFLVGRR